MTTLGREFRTCAFWLALPALVVFSGCRAESQPAGAPGPGPQSDAVLEDEAWSVLFLKGERVGYSHMAVFRQSGDSGEVLRVECEEVMTLRSYGNLIRMESKFVAIETPDGRLLEFSSSLPHGETPMLTSGRVVGDELRLNVSTTGKAIESSIPWSAQYGGPYAVPGMLKSQPLGPGESRTIRAFDVASNQVVTMELTAADYEQIELITESRRLLRIDMVTKLGEGEIEGTIWVDENGNIIRNSVAAVLGYEAIRATKAEALQEVKQIDFDLGRGSAVKAGRLLPAPHDTRRIVYQVRLDDASPAQVFASGVTQQVISKGDATAEIVVYSVRPGSQSVNPDAKPETPTKGDLEPNNLIQSDDPTVVYLAQQAAGQIDDPWQAAVALERFVGERMTSQGISSAFATAAEVARNLTGDCTEHAVLLAAMARARGIPARVAIGLVYHRGEFLYHMWTEVFVVGTWIPLDATLGQGGIGAAHLKITDSNLQGASPQAAFLPVTQVIGQLEIEILEVE